MQKQNVVLKVGIGLVLAIGALTFTPQAAHASSPCETDAPCSPPPHTIRTETDTPVPEPDECLLKDCDGTDYYYYGVIQTNHTYYYTLPSGLVGHMNCQTYAYTQKGPCG